ncbi:hypothetical protein EOW65_09150 [Sinirhodobacter ferrireducens]|uniref:Uncharacterized protein n=1 Tax=Paenirhodobacter ferrireducens TaxID=1215032 RepID=A0A443LJS7_9RHOB|nr:hypothetical protein [Sinirhodobacter ferrireducens]RWR49434.1 hypothetical protein EOW65_09150 [Sinirhodobacter ferrireducens]
MTMRGVKWHSGGMRVLLTCDECCAELPFDVQKKAGAFNGRAAFTVSKAFGRFARSKGWVQFDGTKHLCPRCTRRRHGADPKPKPIEEKTMVQKTEAKQALRQPSQEQRGDIIEMLVLTYDRKAKRYKGADTDKTVAEAVGTWCLPGWVTEIRERDFGPTSGNEEIEAIRAEIAAVQADCAERAAVLGKRLDAVCAAIGPRAARI